MYIICQLCTEIFKVWKNTKNCILLTWYNGKYGKLFIFNVKELRTILTIEIFWYGLQL